MGMMQRHGRRKKHCVYYFPLVRLAHEDLCGVDKEEELCRCSLLSIFGFDWGTIPYAPPTMAFLLGISSDHFA